MSAIACVKDGDTLILATDSRFVMPDGTIASDAEPKIFEVAPQTFIATSGRKTACDFQPAKAREIAATLGTSDVRVIAAELTRETIACLAAMVGRLRLSENPDEGIKQALAGATLLHGCVMIGRTGDECLTMVNQSYFLSGGEVVCSAEEYGGSARKIVFSIGGGMPASLPFVQDPKIWTDAPLAVVERIMAELKQLNPVTGGPNQVVCLDQDGACWIAPPPEARTQLEGGDTLAATITATVSLISPSISGGSFVGASYTATVGTVTISIDPANKRIRINDSALSWYVDHDGGGVYVRDRSYPNQTIAYVTGGQCGAWNYNPATGHQSYATLNANGRIFLQGADGVAGGVWVDGVQRL